MGSRFLGKVILAKTAGDAAIARFARGGVAGVCVMDNSTIDIIVSNTR